jgi:nucleoid-associated protein YgaU
LRDEIEEQRVTFDPPAKADYPTHVVRSGESLFRIARRLLGDGDRRHEIFALNRDLIDDPDDIFPGDNLRLPMDARSAKVQPSES